MPDDKDEVIRELAELLEDAAGWIQLGNSASEKIMESRIKVALSGTTVIFARCKK